MLGSRIDRCLNRILEGIDTGDAQLIVEEASGEFKTAFAKLKDSVESTLAAVQDAGVTGLVEPYQKLVAQIGEAEKGLSEVESEWSWADQIELLKKPSKDSPTETMISSVALAHDTNINAVKDAVIQIAEFLESGGKGLFVVGNKGFEINPAFEELAGENFSLAMMSDPDAISKLVNIDPKDPAFAEEGEEAVAEAVKEKYEPVHGGDENKWKEIQACFTNMNKNIKTLHSECGKRIQSGKPSQEFQDSAPKEGFMKSLLGSLFGSRGGSDIDPAKVMGSNPEDQNGLLAIPYRNLSNLVVNLLELSKEASEAASESVEAIDDNQEEIENKVTSKELRDLLLKGYGEEVKEEGVLIDTNIPKTAKAMGALEEIFGKDKDITLDMIKDNLAELRGKLENNKNFKFQSDEIEDFLEALGLTGEDAEEEIEPVEIMDTVGKRTRALVDFGKKNGVKITNTTAQYAYHVMRDEGLIKLRESFGESKEAFKKEFLEKVTKKINSGNKKQDNKDKELKKFTDEVLDVLWQYFKSKGVQLNENHLIQRWGVLAGIIKG